jgi:hypothetical protein
METDLMLYDIKGDGTHDRTIHSGK